MNLGQLIGELRLRADQTAESEVERPLSAEPVRVSEPAKPRGERQHALMAFLKDGATVDVQAVATALVISREHASVLLFTMATKGLISRHGKRHSYRYTKLGVAANP